MHYPVLAPVARSPIEVLSKAMGHAVHVGLASFVPKASAYADPKVGTDGSGTVPDSAPVRVKPCTVHPQVANCSVLAMFPQSWGSTALGFGGIGGHAITLAYTVLIQGPAGDIAVYWDGEFAYRIVPESMLAEELKSWQDDVRYSTTAAVAQAVKRYGAKPEGTKRSWMGTKRR